LASFPPETNYCLMRIASLHGEMGEQS